MLKVDLCFSFNTFAKWKAELNNLNRLFTNFYRIQVSGVRSLGPDVPPTSLWNFIDVTLADEDTNSMLTDNAKRVIQGNEAMQVI